VISNTAFRRIFVIDRVISDVISLVIAFYLAHFIRYTVQEPLFYRPLSEYYDNFAVGLVAWILLFIRSTLYKHKAQLCKFDQFFSILGNGVLATLTIFTYMALVKESEYARLTIIYFGALGVVFISIGRFSIRKIHNKFRRMGYGVKNVLLVGSGKSGDMLENKIKNHPELGYRLVKVIKPEVVNENGQVSTEKINKLFDETFSFVEKNRVDDIIYIHSRGYKEDIMKLLYLCEDKKIVLTIVPNLFEIMTKQLDFTDIGNIPLIKLKEKPLKKWQEFFKRIIDLALAIPGVIVLLPFMVLVWVLIKIDSQGPGLFSQV